MDLLKKILLLGSPLYFLITVAFFLVNDYSVSPCLPILPLVYAVVFALVYTYRKESFKSFSVSFIFAIWFLRIVLVPLIYVVSGYVSHIKVDASFEFLNNAILLICYEFVCVGFLIILDKKIDLIAQKKVCLDSNCGYEINKVIYGVIFVILSVSVICVKFDQSVLAALSTVFDKLFFDSSANVERRREILYLYDYASSRMIYSVFMQTIYYLQILIPACLLSLFASRKKYGGQKGLLLCFIVVVGSLAITTDNNIDSVYIMIATGVVTLLAYWQITKRYIVPVGVSGIILIFVFLVKKSETDFSTEASFLSSISPTFCAYFSSLPNISAGFLISYEDKFNTFIGDIIAGVPYMMAFFKGFPKSVTLYNEIVHGYTGEVNQIVPLIISGFHYLGVFAPLFTLLVYEIAFKMELSLMKAKTIFNQVLFALIVVNLSTGPCIFGFSNTIKRLCLFLPLLVLAYVNEHVRLNK